MTLGIDRPHYDAAGSASVFSPEGGAAGASAPTGASAARGRVLVVDDEFTIRMLITEVLTDLGCETVEAADGPAALAALEERNDFALLVTDMGLPGGMNGRELADAVRALRPGLSVLFITGYAENAVRGGGTLPAGMHVLTKPFSMEKLAETVSAILAE